jgi:hypothetical protein
VERAGYQEQVMLKLGFYGTVRERK